MLKKEFPPRKHWFRGFKVKLDLGYQGFADIYPCQELSLPKKKLRKQSLNEQDKEENREKARDRIAVEHSIGGLKRYGVLVSRLRMKDIELYNDILEVCAGIWNFYLRE